MCTCSYRDMAEGVQEPRRRSQGFLWVSVFVLAGAPGLARSASAEHDTTCFVQNHHDLVKRIRSLPDSPLTVPFKIHKMFYFPRGIWDYDTDAGGLKPVLDENLGLKYPSHPLWKPEWWRITSAGALRAGACLFLAGVLCCAGGIGGGGIYVTVLMVFGSLSVHDAIPLSKVVVFAASTPSLILNLMKTITLKEGSEGKAKTLIDWNLCRVVVPWALIGTELGVFLNGVFPGNVIVGLLSVILLCMTAMILRTGYQQHCKEMEDEAARGTGPETGPNGDPGESGHQVKGDGPAAQESMVNEGLENLSQSANDLRKTEIFLAVSMLLVIIYCGTVKYHSEMCALAPSSDAFVCHHPIAQTVTCGQMPNLKRMGVCAGVGVAAILVAITYCVVLGACSIWNVVRAGRVYGSLHGLKSIGNSYQGVIVGFYVLMSSVTGCLAGLVGIGGGLIFCPVFIEMGLDPHIAVATSATCVIFTSSSTTFQYLFSDRIIVSLIFSFCIPHLLAAYTGTKLVHYIQDHYGAKKSWITWIVALGVGISFVLAVGKLFNNRPVID